MDTPQPHPHPTFPTYPIKIDLVHEDGGDCWVACSCSHSFHASINTGENLIQIGNMMCACCPSCFGVDKMTKQEHLDGLEMIRLHLESGRATFQKDHHNPVRGWFYAQSERIYELLKHAGSIEWSGNQIYVNDSLSVQISAPLTFIHAPMKDGMNMAFDTATMESPLDIERMFPSAISDSLLIEPHLPMEDPVLTLAESMALAHEEEDRSGSNRA